MLPYFLLIFVPLVFRYVAIKNEAGSKRICIGKSEYIEKNSLLIPVFFFIFFLLLALRNESVGNDTAGYKQIFLAHNTEKFAETLNYGFETIYSFLNWVVVKITDRFQWFLAIVSVLCIYPLYRVYKNDRSSSYLKTIIFVNMSTFIMYFSGIRQSLAMSMGMIAYEFVKKKKILWFIIVCFIAMGFHHSAFMLFFMYPLYHITFKRKHLWFIIPAITVCHIFNRPIFSSLTTLLSMISDEYENISMTETGAITTFLMFIAFAALSFIIPDEEKIDKETIGLRNFLLLAVVLQSFAAVHILAMRMNYYFILFIPIVIGKVLHIPKKQFARVSSLIENLLTAFFLIYFLYTLYSSYMAGTSTLGTVPYVAFWESDSL